jgi:hypothetical protein
VEEGSIGEEMYFVVKGSLRVSARKRPRFFVPSVQAATVCCVSIFCLGISGCRSA